MDSHARRCLPCIHLAQSQSSQYRSHRLQPAAQQLVQLLPIPPGKLNPECFASTHAIAIKPGTIPRQVYILITYLCGHGTRFGGSLFLAAGFWHLGKHLTSAALHLFGRNVLDVLSQRPSVAEGVLELTVTVAPELVRQRHGHSGPCTYSLLEHFVDAVHVEV